MKYKIVLNKLHPSQKQIIDESDRFNVLCCGRRYGKTKLSINLVIEALLRGEKVGYYTPSYVILEEAKRELVAVLRPIITRNALRTENFLQVCGGGTLEIWSLQNDEKAGIGRKYNLVIVDEAALVLNLERSWHQSIRPTLTDYKGKAFICSTPKGFNYFWTLFEKGQHKEHGWRSWQKTTYDNPFIDPKEIDMEKESFNNVYFEQEYLAKPVLQGSGVFDGLEKCIITESKELGRPVVFGIDYGKKLDYTVIIGLDASGTVCFYDRFTAKTTEVTKNRIFGAVGLTPTLFDKTTAGETIFELMNIERNNIEGITFSSWRTKLSVVESLINAINLQMIKIPEKYRQLIIEMQMFQQGTNKNGTPNYAAPPGGNDDSVMALATAWRHFRLNDASRITTELRDMDDYSDNDNDDIWKDMNSSYLINSIW